MHVRAMQTRVSIKDVAAKVAFAFLAALTLCPAYALTPTEVPPETNYLGVILFFVVFVGTIVGGAAYYWWRAKEKAHGTE